MRYIRTIGLLMILLIAACGQPADLSSSAGTDLPSAASVPASPQAVAANVRPVPCPTFAVYPAPLPGETATPTHTPPPPTPTVDPESVPTQTGPGGLGSITLPNDDATIRAIFAALPETIGNYRRAKEIQQGQYSLNIWYQPPNLDQSAPQIGLSLSASSNPGGQASFPGLIIPPSSDYWRRDGQIFYGYYDRRNLQPLDEQYQNCNEVRSVSLTFVAPESLWLFNAEGPTREEVELLIAAFVEAVKASPLPIPYSTPTIVPSQSYPAPQIPTPDAHTPSSSHQPAYPMIMPTSTPGA